MGPKYLKVDHTIYEHQWKEATDRMNNKTVHQMSLGECRLECERLAQRAITAEKALEFVVGVLKQPYDNVVDLEIRVKHLVGKLGATDNV